MITMFKFVFFLNLYLFEFFLLFFRLIDIFILTFSVYKILIMFCIFSFSPLTLDTLRILMAAYFVTCTKYNFESLFEITQGYPHCTGILANYDPKSLIDTPQMACVAQIAFLIFTL